MIATRRITRYGETPRPRGPKTTAAGQAVVTRLWSDPRSWAADCPFSAEETVGWYPQFPLQAKVKATTNKAKTNKATPTTTKASRKAARRQRLAEKARAIQTRLDARATDQKTKRESQAAIDRRAFLKARRARKGPITVPATPTTPDAPEFLTWGKRVRALITLNQDLGPQGSQARATQQAQAACRRRLAQAQQEAAKSAAVREEYGPDGQISRDAAGAALYYDQLANELIAELSQLANYARELVSR